MDAGAVVPFVICTPAGLDEMQGRVCPGSDLTFLVQRESSLQHVAVAWPTLLLPGGGLWGVGTGGDQQCGMDLPRLERRGHRPLPAHPRPLGHRLLCPPGVADAAAVDPRTPPLTPSLQMVLKPAAPQSGLQLFCRLAEAFRPSEVVLPSWACPQSLTPPAFSARLHLKDHRKTPQNDKPPQF